MQRTQRVSALVFTGLLAGPLSAVSFAQPPVPPPGHPGPPPGGPGGGMGMLLRSEEVRDELALTEDQMLELREMAEEMRGRMHERMRGREGRRGEGFRGPKRGARGPEAGERRGPPREGRRGPGGERGRSGGEMRERMRAMQEEVETKIGGVLEEDQMQRLRELTVQAQVEHGGPMALLHGELGETLGVTEEQRDQIHDRAKEIRKEIGEQMREIRKAHHAELLDVLTSEQRAQLDGMMGEPFDLPEPEFPGFRRGRGGPGGPPEFGGRPPRRGDGEGRRGPRGSGRKGPGPQQAESEAE